MIKHCPVVGPAIIRMATGQLVMVVASNHPQATDLHNAIIHLNSGHVRESDLALVADLPVLDEAAADKPTLMVTPV